MAEQIDIKDADEIARAHYTDGYEAGGQEAWDILAKYIDRVILHKVFGTSDKLILDKWPVWDTAREQLLSVERLEHKLKLEQRVRNFINFMVQSGFTQDEILSVWSDKENKNGD